MMRQQWFCEGLAVSFGEQKSYINPQEFLDFARVQDLGPSPFLWGRNEISPALQCWEYPIEQNESQWDV